MPELRRLVPAYDPISIVPDWAQMSRDYFRRCDWPSSSITTLPPLSFQTMRH